MRAVARDPETERAAWAADRARAQREHELEVERLATTRRRERVKRAHVPLPAEAVELIARAAWDSTPATRAALTWIGAGPDREPVLVLLGRPGVGKTFAGAVAIAKRTPHGGAYVRARELAALSVALFGADATRYRELLEVPGVLVVDELGADIRRAEDERTAVHEAVDERLGRGGLVLASNLTATALERHLDERTVDRLRAHARVVKLGGTSRRRKP